MKNEAMRMKINIYIVNLCSELNKMYLHFCFLFISPDEPTFVCFFTTPEWISSIFIVDFYFVLHSEGSLFPSLLIDENQYDSFLEPIKMTF